MSKRRPKLAVWKFASCDGCQLSLLDLEDELLELAEQVRIADFREASRAVIKGPYDLSLVEGSVTTPDDERRIREIRRKSKTLITIGACATAGGVQALRNSKDLAELRSIVYAKPEYIETLATSTPISGHVSVDHEIYGCPIDKQQLLRVLLDFLHGRPVRLPSHSVCVECKRRDNPCVLVAQGTACLGPVTRTGCGALCPTFGRGCYGCFGPAKGPNLPAMERALSATGVDKRRIRLLYSTFNAASPLFERAASAAQEDTEHG